MQPLLRPASCMHYPDAPGFELVQDYGFTVAGGGAFTVPAGFWYNGASIPAAFWQVTFSPFDPRILAPALVHDWLYTSKQVPRKVADETLAMLIAETSPARAQIVRAAVRSFGGFVWPDSRADRDYIASLSRAIVMSGRGLSAYGLAKSSRAA